MKDILSDVPNLWDDYKRIIHDKGISSVNVVIHGGYGKNNMGDDAILDVLINRVQTHIPNANITVLCHGPDYVMREYENVESCYFKSIGAFKAILKSHIYIIGGGGIINVINVYSGYRFFRIFDMKGKFLFIATLIAKFFGAHTNFYAVGATSFPDPLVKILAKIALGVADVVSVRDELSMRNLRGIGVNREIIQVLDPALSLEPAPEEEGTEILIKHGFKKNDRPLVGLNMRYVREKSIDNDKIIDEAVRVVEYLIEEKKCNVIFLPISQHPTEHYEDDFDFGVQIKSKLPESEYFCIVSDYYHPKMMMTILGLMDFCILERLHAVILASKMNVPFYVISYDNKVTEYVKLVGQEKRMVDLPQFSFEKMRELIDEG